MLTMLVSPRGSKGVTRRETLKFGALSVLSGFLNLPSLRALEQNRKQHLRPGKAKSVILFYLHGGAPTQDMFDLKPNAPAEIRGEFKPIATSASGIQICEHLPRMANWMHKAAIVRTVNHKAGCHNTLPSYTGYEVMTDISNPSDLHPPSMGSVCEYLKPPTSDMPAYMHLPNYLGWGFALRRPGPYAGFLGKRYDPLCSECNPRIEKDTGGAYAPIWLGEPYLADTVLAEGLTLNRLAGRKTLLQQLDDQARRAESRPAFNEYGRTQERAFSLLTSSKLKSAFNLENEDPRVRDRYGRTLFGASTLIARRLVEQGVRFLNVSWDGYSSKIPTNSDPYWDTHSWNFKQLRRVNLPHVDLTFSGLLEDLNDRGLLDETLVVMMSDFGRTPRVNAAAGRDHWTYCYSVLFAGAGIRGGTLCGASDAHAAFVKDRPTSTGDICATIYQCLGIDPEMPVYDRSGRPIPVANGGKAIREILA